MIVRIISLVLTCVCLASVWAIWFNAFPGIESDFWRGFALLPLSVLTLVYMAIAGFVFWYGVLDKE